MPQLESTRKVLALLLLATIAVVACNKSQPKEEHKDKQKDAKDVVDPAPYRQVFGLDIFSKDYGFLHSAEGVAIGAGYNSEIAGFPGGLCLDSNNAANYLNSPPNTSTALANGFVRSVTKEIDTRTLLTRTYDIHASGNGGLGIFSASVDVSSSGSYASSENRRLFLAEYVATSPPRLLNLSDVNKLLTPAALDALNADKDGKRFLQKCGDYVVIGYYLGAGGSLLMSYDAISDDEAQRTAASLEANFAGIGGVSGSASGTMHSLTESRNLQSSFVGWGGITEADLEQGVPSVQKTVETKLAGIQGDALPSASQGLIVRVLLAPWSNLLPERFQPKPQHSDLSFETFVDLTDRRAQLEALARSYDLTKNDRGDIRDIVWGMTAQDRLTLDHAIRRTTVAMQEVNQTIKDCLSTKPELCGKYDKTLVRPAPSGSVWKLREGGAPLIEDVCSHSKPDVGVQIAPPELDKTKPVIIGLFGTYSIKDIDEDWSLIFNKANMRECCSKYTFIFFNSGDPSSYFPHGQAVTVNRVDNIILQVEKWPKEEPSTQNKKTEDLFPCSICSCPDFVEGNKWSSVICNRSSCGHNAVDHGLGG